MFLDVTRSCKQTPYDKVIFARNRKLSSTEKSKILKSNIVALGFLAMFGFLSMRAFYDPWQIHRFKGKLINYRPERYVEDRSPDFHV